MVYSLARDIHAACGMVRQKRKEENSKKESEREGEGEKKVESDGVLQGGGVILRHWHKQLLY